MAKIFNTVGCCEPELHYMVDAGMYFTINRARQFGKTTTLNALTEYLKSDYTVVSMDFQTISTLSFENERSFVAAFCEELMELDEEFPDGIEEKLSAFTKKTDSSCSLQTLFKVLKLWCAKAERKIVLVIDEVDTASNVQVFVDFLAQLRAYYLKRMRMPSFQSVILAGYMMYAM